MINSLDGPLNFEANRMLRELSIALGVFVSSRVCSAQVTIQVLSRPRLNTSVQCLHSGTECLIKGSLVDDLGSPLPNQRVQGLLELQGNQTSAVSARLDSCDEFGGSSAAQPQQAATIQTDDAGKYCFRVEAGGSAPKASVSINYQGKLGYESTMSRVSLVPGDAAASLKVLESPDRIALESPSVAISIELSAPGQETAGLPVSLGLEESAFRGKKAKGKYPLDDED